MVYLSDTKTVQVVFNVSGGQRVEVRRRGGSVRQTIQAGSIGIVSPDCPTFVSVAGRADTVQIILHRELLGLPLDGLQAPPGLRAASGSKCLQAAAIQALVALAGGRSRRRDTLPGILRQVAAWLATSVAPSTPGLARGGLSPAARRRVGALMDERLQPDDCLPLATAELAQAAGLSVHHFIKAFRRTEGATPYAAVIARRLDRALHLLLQPKARVDWIATQTGFSSPAHFVSAFRQHMGTTPGALRDAASIQ